MQTIPTATVKTARCAANYLRDLIDGDTDHRWEQRSNRFNCNYYTNTIYRDGEIVHYIEVNPKTGTLYR
jgi:hypothetical protein